MTYTGKVTPGGAADVRTTDHLVIRKVSVGELDNCCYLLTDRATGDQLLIDAADDASRLLSLVAEGTGRLSMVLTTHRHWDHHRALAEVVRRTGASTLAGVDDVEGIPVRTDVALPHGGTVSLGATSLQIIQLRGHTPGSVAVAYADDDRVHLFTGDSLFPDGVGSTQGDPDRFRSLLTDVEERVFARFDDHTWVYPGHGADTTLGAERPHLPDWRERGW